MAFNLFKRLLVNLLTLAVILTLTFFLLHLLPGGPFDQERHLPAEIEHNIYEKYGLTPRGDQGFWPWFLADTSAYFGYLAKGELGPSLKYRDRDVSEIIAKGIGPSLELGGLALLFALAIGIGAGVLSASSSRSYFESGFFALSTLLISVPSFVIAVVLILIFSLQWGVLPPALWEGATHRILPIITLMLTPMATFFQFTHAGMRAELAQAYVQTARAKGLPLRSVLLKHAFKNALSPLLTLTGPIAAYLITGSFIVETIFSIPGLGKHFIIAVLDRDYFLVMGITLLYAAVLITLNWLVDLSQLKIDPRVREEDL